MLMVVLAGNVIVWQNYGLAYRFVAILPQERLSQLARRPLGTALYVLGSELLCLATGLAMGKSLATQEVGVLKEFTSATSIYGPFQICIRR